MFFFQESTPDTSAYLIAGYTIAFTVMAIYVASLVIRWRNLRQDLRTLENIQAESGMSEPKVSKPGRVPAKKTGSGPRKSKAPARKKK
jgi:hypothetical protein